MKQKNVIALVLTGLFLIHLTVTHLGGLIQLVSKEEIARYSLFCPKSSAIKAAGEASMLVSTAANPSIEIPVFCNSYFDFKVEAFSTLFVEENHLISYIYNDEFYSDLFSVRHYIPPRI